MQVTSSQCSTFRLADLVSTIGGINKSLSMLLHFTRRLVETCMISVQKAI